MVKSINLLLCCFIVWLQVAKAETAAHQNYDYVAPKMRIKEFLIQGISEDESHQQINSDLSLMIKKSLKLNQQAYDIDALRQLTDSITQYYRDQGYFLATCFIPEQTVKEATVYIQVLVGTLAAVVTEDNRVYKSKTLQKAFKSSLGHGVSRDDISRNLLLVNDFPGYSGMGVFSPSENIGQTNLILKAKSENKFDTSVTIDNYGSQFTGRYRLQLNSAINNITSSADRLAFNFIQSIDPTNSTVFSIDYKRPLMNAAWLLDVSYNNNQYTVGDVFEGLNIHGQGQSGQLATTYKFLRSSDKNRYFKGGLSVKQNSSSGIGTQYDDQLLVLFTQLQLFGQSPSIQGQYNYTLGLSQGINAFDQSDNKRFKANFSKLYASASQSIGFSALKSQYLLLNLNSQYSPHLLSSSERLALGGSQSVRVYPSSAYSVDSGVVVNAQWLLKTQQTANLGWFSALQFSAFLDLATGNINHQDAKQLTSEGNSVFLSGTGLGVALLPNKGIQLNLDVGYALTQAEPADETQFSLLFSAGYQL